MALSESTLKALSDSARERRGLLNAAMSELAAHDIGCSSCSGICCSVAANSMQITPVEAVDLLQYLRTEKGAGCTPFDSAELVAKLEACVARYGLDRPAVGDGRRIFTRRHYTCPFFAGGSKGCTISRSAKPYGCLGFNAKRQGVVEGEACASDQQLLETQERTTVSVTAELQEAVASQLGLTWQKLPIPQALLSVLDAEAKG